MSENNSLYPPNPPDCQQAGETFNTGCAGCPFMPECGYLAVAGVIETQRQELAAANEEKATIAEEASYDKMLNILTRHAFDEHVRKATQEPHRHTDGQSTLLMIDLDHFKAINDAEGHPVGDDVLRSVTECLRSTVREDDTVGRLGGEEFGVFMKGANATEAIAYTVRLREALTAIERPGGGFRDHITCSIGIAEIYPGQGNYEKAYGVADKALYMVKRAGRDGVAVSDVRGISLVDVPENPAQS